MPTFSEYIASASTTKVIRKWYKLLVNIFLMVSFPILFFFGRQFEKSSNEKQPEQPITPPVSGEVPQEVGSVSDAEPIRTPLHVRSRKKNRIQDTGKDTIKQVLTEIEQQQGSATNDIDSCSQTDLIVIDQSSCQTDNTAVTDVETFTNIVTSDFSANTNNVLSSHQVVQCDVLAKPSTTPFCGKIQSVPSINQQVQCNCLEKPMTKDGACDAIRFSFRTNQLVQCDSAPVLKQACRSTKIPSSSSSHNNFGSCAGNKGTKITQEENWGDCPLVSFHRFRSYRKL